MVCGVLVVCRVVVWCGRCDGVHVVLGMCGVMWSIWLMMVCMCENCVLCGSGFH